MDGPSPADVGGCSPHVGIRERRPRPLLRTSLRAGLVLCGALAVVGVWLGLTGVVTMRPLVGPGWQSTPGTVVSVAPVVAAVSQAPRYRPTLSFVDDSGAVHVVVAAVPYSKPPVLGSHVTVAYDPQSPDTAVVTGGSLDRKWRLLTLLGAATTAAAAFGCWVCARRLVKASS